MLGVQRWVFKDLVLGTSYTVPLNPNAMTSPYPQRKYVYNSTTAGPAGSTVTNEAHSDPIQWQFSGDILDQAHFDGLVFWSRKLNRLQITDHFGRILTVTLDQFNPIPKRAYGKYWRHTYTMTASVYAMLDASTPPPTVISVLPFHGLAGIDVVITGLNFTGVTAVHFGGASAAFTFNSDSSITAEVPAGTGSVAVTVTTPKGTSSGSGTFLYGFVL